MDIELHVLSAAASEPRLVLSNLFVSVAPTEMFLEKKTLTGIPARTTTRSRHTVLISTSFLIKGPSRVFSSL